MICKIIGCLSLLCSSMTLFSQSQCPRFNDGFIISVNSELSGISKVKFILSDTLKKNDTIEVEYVPGNIFFLNSEDKRRLYNDTTSIVVLAFERNGYYYKHKKGRYFSQYYQVKIDKEWLKYNSMVLKIQYLNKRNHPSLTGDRYSVTYDFPGGRTILSIVKR